MLLLGRSLVSPGQRCMPLTSHGQFARANLMEGDCRGGKWLLPAPHLTLSQFFSKNHFKGVKSMSTTRRNKGEGSITTLANGKYRVRIELPPKAGKRIWKSATCTTKKEAIQKLKELSRMYCRQSSR